MSESKKKAQVFRVGGTHYASVVSTTQMIWREKGRELTCDKLLKEMHIQWQIAGNKNQEEKDSNNENKVVATATQKGGRKKAYSNPNKDKTCNHCKKKGNVGTQCWMKHPKLIPDKVKAASKKQVEMKSEKSSTAATAVDEEEIILNMIELENENIKLSHFYMNNAYFTFPINDDIMHLQDMFEENDEESFDKEIDDDDTSPYVTVLKDLAEVEIKVQEELLCLGS
jgi:hypothetical protein